MVNKMIYDIFHKTEFVYQSPVTFSHNLARLKPKTTSCQKLLDFSMEISPEVFETHEFTDMFGNNTTHMLIREPHQALVVTGRSKVQLFPEYREKHLEHIKLKSITYAKALDRLSHFQIDDVFAKQYLFESALIPYASESIREYALKSFAKNRDLFEAAQEFMERIFFDFDFVSGFSDITTPIEEIFEAKKGVCQDFAQFAISVLRSIGLPAQYRSGYIETLPQEGKEKLFGADASHAWFSLYIPNAGWIDFDPTNNLIPKDQHILLGSGRDYHDISPLKGVVMGSGESKLSVMVDVRREETSKQKLNDEIQRQMQSQQ